MPSSLYFDGNLRRIYEVPELSSFTVDGSGYRSYVPDNINSAEERNFTTSTELWSGFVDYHNQEKWTTNAFAKTGGAFRFVDSNGISIFATFDIRLINSWLLVPANYPHDWTVLGNVFEELGLGQDFDTDRITSLGVSPRVRFADSNQTLIIPGASNITPQTIHDAVWSQSSDQINPNDKGKILDEIKRLADLAVALSA